MYYKELIYLKKIIDIKFYEYQNLPIEQSSLALDLFIFIAFGNLKDNPPTLKELFNSINYSETGVRKHLNRLLAEGWCHLEGSGHDKRLRHVVAEPKMINAVINYINQVNHIITT